MSAIQANKTASNTRTILLAADRNYFPYALFFADMIDRRHPDRDFDICIISPAPLPEHDLVGTLGLRMICVDMAEIAKDLHTDERFSVAAYLRLLAPQILRDDYSRILYLDSDMMLMRGDLSELLKIDMGGHAIAAVRDDTQLRKPDRIPKDFAALGLPNHKYLNSGLLLIDTEKFLTDKIGERALNLATSQTKNMIYHDQTALNATLKGEWAELPMAWNFQFCHKTMYFAVHFNPAILHFITSQKPWSSSKGIFPAWIQDQYRAFFSRHFPESAAKMGNLPPPAQRPKTHLMILLIHAFNFRRFIKNAARFQNLWDIKT